MGLAIDRSEFLEGDYLDFSSRLGGQLERLEELLTQPGFGAGMPTLGAELAVFLVDGSGQPLPRNQEVLARVTDTRVTAEMTRFNLECHVRPKALSGRTFTALAVELQETLLAARQAAGPCGARLAVIGCLPTLTLADFGAGALTDAPRFRALAQGLRHWRRTPLDLAIEGAEQLAVSGADFSLGGANTALQLHLKVGPRDFARFYNAAQLAIAPVLAASGNSPFLLGRQLWQETRIPLVEQSVDDRPDWAIRAHTPSRASFGNGWVRGGAAELFRESVQLHPPVLPLVAAETLAGLPERNGAPPLLFELRLHHGTVWRWNRVVYDPVDGGHLRLEMRALPAGPTLLDMLANAAMLLGLTWRLSSEMNRLMPAMPFEHARENFYAAAREGLDATLCWPTTRGASPRPEGACPLLRRLLPLAREGLLEAGVTESDIDPLLWIFGARCQRGMTGARWQIATVQRLEPRLGRAGALTEMLRRYLELAAHGNPVHTWPLG